MKKRNLRFDGRTKTHTDVQMGQLHSSRDNTVDERLTLVSVQQA